MNARAVAVLVVLLAALGGGALLVYQQNRAQPPAAAGALGAPVLPGLQAADIASIVIREPGATLTLQRRAQRWTIPERAHFPAQLAKVRELVLGVLALKVGHSEPLPEAERARLKLDASGTRLEFRDADGQTLATLVVGAKYFKREPANAGTASADGRFVLVPDKPDRVSVVADPLPLATAASAAWVDKTGFGAEHVRSMEVDLPGGKWRVARPSLEGDWKLTPLYAGEKLDVVRANSATYSLNRVEIADVAPAGLRPDQTGLDKPITVVAQTFDGLTYTLKLGDRREDNYYVTLWISGEPRPPAGPDAKERARSLAERLPREEALAGHVLLIARSKFEDVLRKRAELLEAKAPAKK